MERYNDQFTPLNGSSRESVENRIDFSNNQKGYVAEFLHDGNYLKKEKWQEMDAPYHGYIVSNRARIFSLKTNTLMVPLKRSPNSYSFYIQLPGDKQRMEHYGNNPRRSGARRGRGRTKSILKIVEEYWDMSWPETVMVLKKNKEEIRKRLSR